MKTLDKNMIKYMHKILELYNEMDILAFNIKALAIMYDDKKLEKAIDIAENIKKELNQIALILKAFWVKH